jgi:hypothetical protein
MEKRMRRLSLLVSIILIAGMAAVSAQTFSYTPTPSFTFNHVYNTTSSTSATFTVTRTPKPTGSESNDGYFLISNATRGSSFQVGQRRVYRDDLQYSIPVYIYPTSGMTAELGTKDSSIPVSVLPFTLSRKDGSASVTLYVMRGTGIVPDGVYQNTFTLQVYYGSLTHPGGTLVAGEFMSFTVTVNVALANITVTITPSTLAFTPPGQSMMPDTQYDASATMIVESTVPYNMKVSSTNNGKIVLTSEDIIPYTFKLDGYVYPIVTGGTDLPSGLAGSNDYNLTFTAQYTDYVQPGTYVDNITFTVTAK